jgi:adenosine deaminase
MLAEQAAQIEAETNGAVVIRLNMGTIRGGHLTSGLENILNNTRMHGTQYLQGVDLVGNESDSPALTAAHPVYRAVHNRNATHPSEVLHLTMHAGEFGAPENPRDAILMGAERIGHAVKLDQDGVTTEYAARNHFPIEANPLSNLRLGVVPSIARHPFLKQLRLGMRVSLSTDDEGIFDTNISQECATVVGGTDITYNELKQMSFNSLETAFLPEERKERLRQQLEHDFVSFEASRSR